MKSQLFLKLLLLPCAALLWSSCLVPEDVVSSGEFVPLKTLSISPDSAKVGDKIIITGENFVSKKDYNQVWFSPNVKAEIDSATKTQLFLKVPDGAVTGDVVVSNGAFADTIRSGFKVIPDADAPLDIVFSPQTGYEGSRIFVSGKNIDDPSTVIISGIKTSISWYGSVNNLSFVIPKGAKTSRIVIINKKSKPGVSDKALKIITENQSVKAAFDGIRVIKKTAHQTNTPFQTTYSTDTLIIRGNDSISRTLMPNRFTFENVGFCFWQTEQLPYPDSVLQSFHYGANFSYPFTYKAFHLTIDSANHIIKFLKISTFYYQKISGKNTNDFSTRDCNTTRITLENVPYDIINGKKSFRLNSSDLKKYLTQYKSTEDNYYFKESGTYLYNEEKHRTVDGIYEILPDAYFELTLE